MLTAPAGSCRSATQRPGNTSGVRGILHDALHSRQQNQQTERPVTDAVLDTCRHLSTVSTERELACRGLEGQPGILTSLVSGSSLAFCSLCKCFLPSGTFILRVVLKLVDTNLTKTQCWKRYLESAPEGDRTKTPPTATNPGN